MYGFVGVNGPLTDLDRLGKMSNSTGEMDIIESLVRS